jgi:hypothetical protein
MAPDRHLAVDPCRLPGRPHVGFLKPERPLKPWSAPPDSVLLTRDAMPQARIVRPVDKRPASHPLPPAAFIHSSPSPALRMPSYSRSRRTRKTGEAGLRGVAWEGPFPPF